MIVILLLPRTLSFSSELLEMAKFVKIATLFCIKHSNAKFDVLHAITYYFVFDQYVFFDYILQIVNLFILLHWFDSYRIWISFFCIKREKLTVQKIVIHYSKSKFRQLHQFQQRKMQHRIIVVVIVIVIVVVPWTEKRLKSTVLDNGPAWLLIISWHIG